MSYFVKARHLTPWRKIALVSWGHPQDPSVYGQFDFDATPLLHYLEQVNRQGSEKVTLTHLIGKALGLVLARYPSANGIIRWGTLYLRSSVDIFFQVAIPHPDDDKKESLSGAKISNIDKKSLPELARELREQAHRIRHEEDLQFGKTFQMARWVPVFLLRWLVRLQGFLVFDLGLSLPKLGLFPDPFGSAMLTSLGSLGIPPGFPPLAPPSRCPLLICVGAVTDKPVVTEDKKIEVRPVVTLCSTFDHRFMDGLIASRMFKFLLEILKDPAKYL